MAVFAIHKSEDRAIVPDVVCSLKYAYHGFDNVEYSRRKLWT
jgi:hypothetical protein